MSQERKTKQIAADQVKVGMTILDRGKERTITQSAHAGIGSTIRHGHVLLFGVLNHELTNDAMPSFGGPTLKVDELVTVLEG